MSSRTVILTLGAAKRKDLRLLSLPLNPFERMRQHLRLIKQQKHLQFEAGNHLQRKPSSMRRGKWLRFWLAAAPFVAGCAGFWNAPTTTTSSGCTTDCTTSSSGDFYILSAGTTPEIAGEVINSGTLTAISGSPFSLSTLGTPYAMALDGSSFLYVSTTAGVYVFPITNGALGSGTAVDQNTLTALAIGIDGNWLVEAVQSGTGVVTFNAVPLNPSTGGNNGSVLVANFQATANSPSVMPGQMVVSPDGKDIFVALGTGGVVIIPFNSSAAATANPFGSAGFITAVQNSTSSALSVAVDPNENLYYVGETNANSAANSGAILAYLYSSIGAKPVLATSASVATGGLSPSFILPASAGAELYVANGQGTGTVGNIASFSVSGSDTTWTITAGPTIAAGTQPISLAIDSTDTFLLAANSVGNPGLSTYTFGTTPGSLTVQITADTGPSPLQILAAPQ
jgi:6-phosphogluconolactonase